MKPERIGKIMRVAPKADLDALASEQELEMICREVEPSGDIQVSAGTESTYQQKQMISTRTQNSNDSARNS
jgi:hypothetical protein